jgi:hypothetical protein
MPFKSRFLQRAFLAFTTGLFLACAAQLSAAGAQPVPPTASALP